MGEGEDGAGTTPLEAAATLLRQGDVAGATGLIDRALAATPDDPRALTLKVAAFSAVGGHWDALPFAEKAARLAPEDAQIGYNHAAILANTGQLAEATAAFDRVLGLALDGPTRVGVLLARGRLMLERDEPAAAERDLERAVAQAPQAAEAHAALAEARFGLGKLAAAKAAIEEARRRGDGSGRAAAILGRIELALGAADKAAAAYREAVTADPDLAHAHTGLAEALLRLDDEDGAAAATDAFLAARPIGWRAGAQTPAARVLVLEALGGVLADPRPSLTPHGGSNFIGQTPTRRLAYGHAFADHPASRAAAEAALGTVDVVFNNWATPEIAPLWGGEADLRGLVAAAEAAGKPVLNHPDATAAVSRAANAEAYRDVTDFVFPKTRLIPARLTNGADAPASVETRRTLALVAVPLPMILRPVDTQRGGGAVVLEDEIQLTRALAQYEDVDLYAIAYHDCASDDGIFRRYRLSVVGDAVNAENMHVAGQWNVHGSEREDFDWTGRGLDREEQAFLAEPEALLGGAARAVFAPILARTALDIYGIDFGRTRDGRLIVFEVNAAMSFTSVQLVRRYPYLAPSRARLVDDIEALILARGGKTPG